MRNLNFDGPRGRISWLISALRRSAPQVSVNAIARARKFKKGFISFILDSLIHLNL
jgi:hypothetical protein